MTATDDLYLRLKQSYERDPEGFDDPLLARAFRDQQTDQSESAATYRRMVAAQEQKARATINVLEDERDRLTGKLKALRDETTAHQQTLSREVRRLEGELAETRNPTLYRLGPDEADALAAIGAVKNAEH